ncbi:MAG: class I SAM-dependent methyltransferase [Acidobacteriota bacterium]|nr:class I SAM-dependent methyltransferase [Acidobacteriota bacterium]
MRRLSFFLLFGAFALSTPAFGQHFKNPDTLGPDMPTPPLVIERMLEAAHLKPGEMVYDLGCGEGRVVIMAAQKFKARAVGIELSRDLYEQTFNRIKQMGLDQQILIVHGNALHYDLSPADVVTIYFLTSSNDRLRPVFERSLRPGTRVVSHDYEIRGWKPAIKESIAVGGRPHSIFVYNVGRHGAE